MAVKYAGGGGGLFSSFLPSLLKLGGAAIGGPAGAAIGSGLSAAASGGSVGDVLGSAAGGYLGANKGINGNFWNPDAFSQGALANAVNPQQGVNFSGWSLANDPSWNDLYQKINSGAL